MALVGNLINWYIGYVIMAIWMEVGYFFGIFGMWQLGADGVASVYEGFAMDAVGDVYTNDMTIAS